MSFRITGLDVSEFRSFSGLSDDDLRGRGALRVIAEKCPGYPDRIELRDAMPGESLILVNYTHQPAASPYRSSHAIYVLEHPTHRYDRVGEIPKVLRTRAISLRAFDDAGMIVAAELCDGADVEPAIEKLLEEAATSYLHLHYAKFGCFACRVDRVAS